MDIAIIGLKQKISESHISEPIQQQFNNPTTWHYEQGEPVYAIGYEAPPWHSHLPPWPLVTQGVLCKCVGGMMLMTSAVVLPGMSGGVIVSGINGEIMGMIVSNSQ